MRNTVAVAIFLTALSAAPVLSQETAPVNIMPVIPEIAAPAPAAVEQPAGWTAVAAEDAVPAPVVIKEPIPAVTHSPAARESGSFQAWVEKEAQNAPQIKYINTENTELVRKMSSRQIFIYTPKNEFGMAVIPEPASMAVMAGGLSGMALSLYRRRRNK